METIGLYEPQRIDAELLTEEVREVFRQRGWLKEGPRTAGSPEGSVKHLTPEERARVNEMVRHLRALGYVDEPATEQKADSPAGRETATQPSQDRAEKTDGR